MDETDLRGELFEIECVVSWFVAWFEVVEAWLVGGLEVEVGIALVCVFEVAGFVAWLVESEEGA